MNSIRYICTAAAASMIVAEWSKTTVGQLKDTINLIMESDVPVMGVIVNKVKVDRLVSESMAYYTKYYNDKKIVDVSQRI